MFINNEGLPKLIALNLYTSALENPIGYADGILYNASLFVCLFCGFFVFFGVLLFVLF